jgi:Holliday junction resolvasome RuvABC ATP-dependent DNA helicase subunit
MILDLFRKEIEFDNIHVYDDIKDIVRRALQAEDSYNLLFVGPPASAKTLFLLGILERRKGVYFDGSNSTNRILDVLEENRPKIMCIDELDKMPRQFQEKLLNFMESGHIKVDQVRRQYDFRIKGAKVFAACNEITRLSRPLQSRFRCLHHKHTKHITNTTHGMNTGNLINIEKKNGLKYEIHYVIMPCYRFRSK